MIHNIGIVTRYYGLYLVLITIVQMTSDYLVIPLANEISVFLFSMSNPFVNTLAATFVRDFFDFLLLYGIISSIIFQDFQISKLFQVFKSRRDLKKCLFCYLIAGFPGSVINLSFIYFSYIERIDQSGQFLLLSIILLVLSFIGILWKYNMLVSFQTNQKFTFKNRLKETWHVFKGAISGLAILELSFLGWLMIQCLITGFVIYYWNNPVLTSLSSPAIFGLGVLYVPYYTMTISSYNLQLFIRKT